MKHIYSRYLGKAFWAGGFILLKENSPAKWIPGRSVETEIKRSIKENLGEEWRYAYYYHNLLERATNKIIYDYCAFTQDWRTIYSLQGDKLFDFDEGERKFEEVEKVSDYYDFFWKKFYDEYLNPLIGKYHESFKMYIDDDYIERFKRAIEMTKINWLNLKGEVVYFYDLIHENKPNSVLLNGERETESYYKETLDSPDEAFIYNPFAKYFTDWNFYYYRDNILRDFFNIVFNCELEQAPLCIMEDGKIRHAITSDKIIEKQPDCQKKFLKKLSAYGISKPEIISRLVD